MNRSISLLVAGVALAVSVQASAAGDIEQGKAKVATCVACHGQDGNSIDPQYPRLAGQYADYLAMALHEYKDGRRGNAVMTTFAAQLSDEDINDVSAYFGSLPTKLDDLHNHIQGAQ